MKQNQLEISRTAKDTHLDTILYELRMLDYSFQKLSNDKEWDDPADQFIYLEAFLLHYRNAIQFFAGNGHKEGSLSTEDSEIWAGRPMTPEEKNTIQLPGKNLIKLYWESISKYLQHCTVERKDQPMSWNVSKMYDEINPITKMFIQIFGQLK